MRYLDGPTLRDALPMIDCIDAMRSAFGDDTETPSRVALAGSLFMPGRVADVTGVKVVSTVPGNPVGLVMVFGPDGSPLGLVDGPTLTAIRTAAGAGLATDLMAPPGPAVMAMLGAGAMAADQVAALRAVRPVDEVRVWSRRMETAMALAERIDARTVRTAADALDGATIVTTATPSTLPLFADADAGSVRHVNAVGAFTPSMVEIPPDLVRRAYVVVDDRSAASAEAGDLLQANVEPDATMADVLAGRVRPGGPLTLFKSVGIASQDVAAARRALHRAGELGIGVVL